MRSQKAEPHIGLGDGATRAEKSRVEPVSRHVLPHGANQKEFTDECPSANIVAMEIEVKLKIYIKVWRRRPLID
jgi:hypothetical protein